jgi:peptidoglycan/LPS O-acetylase OafA/YrhL
MGILRILLAISVVLAHSSSIFGFSLVGGQIAVQAFYIISGFYMSLILNEKYIGVNNSYKLFISNRLLRLYPIYWTILLLTILYSVAISFYSKGNYLGNFEPYYVNFEKMSFGSFILLLFTNLFLFLQDTIMFLGLDTSTGNLFFTSNFRQTTPQLYTFLFIEQAWTVGVEITFYLIAPFLVKRKPKIIILLILLSFILRAVLYFHFGLKNDPWTYRFFPTELVFFLLGTISYWIYKKLQTLEVNNTFNKLIWVAILAFTLGYSFLPMEAKSYLYLITFFISLPFIFIYTKTSKIDSYIGELSYPIYISHNLVKVVITSIKLPMIGGKGLVLTLLTIIFSIVLNELLTKKIEKIRQKRIIPNPSI